MNPRPADAPEPVLLIIADISGYTRYMTANAKTLAHSQTIITELIHAIVQQIELPLEVAKLEGDAVFLYCRKQGGALPWPEAKRVVGERLFTFFSEFSGKLGELIGSTTCTCHACTHIEQLRLKVVVHSGEALFHRVLNFVELAGVDVIIIHRLLKNSVNADQDLLLTEAARRELLEETGYAADHIEAVTTGAACSGITSERVTLFHATQLRRVGTGGGVAHEDITVHEVPLAEVVPWLEAKAKIGVLVDPKVYAGLFFITQNK